MVAEGEGGGQEVGKGKCHWRMKRARFDINDEHKVRAVDAAMPPLILEPFPPGERNTCR